MPFKLPGHVRVAVLGTLTVLVAACSGGDTARPVAVARVAISGVSDSITVGDRRPLTVALSDANGSGVSGRHVTWTSSDATIAIVDTIGVVSAVAPGRATISAESQGVRGELTVMIRRRPVVSVTMDRAVDTLWLGRTHVVHAQTGAADGTALTDRSVTWVSSDTTLITVAPTADGGVVVRGAGIGATRLIARSEGVETALPVVVIAIPVKLLDVLAPDTVLVGRSVALQARAWAPDGTQLTSSDLAGRAVTWSTDRATQLTVAGVPDAVGQTTSGLTATAHAAAAGNATITATFGGQLARYTIITSRAPVARLTFPASVSLKVGDTVTVGATPYDAQGLTVADAPLVYSLATGAGVVRLTPVTAADGSASVLIEALTPGSAAISVSADGRIATLAATVAVSPASLRVYPTSIATVPEAHGRLTVSLVDASGVSQQTGAITYRTSNPAIVNIDDLGSLTTGSTGSASLLVTVGGTTITVPVTVSTPPTSAFHIDVRPVGNVPAEVVAAAQAAARRWERVIIGELPPAQVDLAPSDCDLGTPALHQAVTSLVVFLMTKPIDGNRGTLAYAGPCVTRAPNATGLPLVGSMTVDSADVSLLTGATGALAEDVITHELGHVLGIGTLWSGGTSGGNMVKSFNGDPRFVGPAATAATARIGLAASGIDGAPIEDTGGIGTAGAHWRERTFAGELMTGWINPAPNPLSIVTVLSLRDLGYQVTETGADIVSPVSIVGGPAFGVSLPSSSRGPLFSRGTTITSPIPLGERLLKPKFVAGDRGTRKQ